MRSFSNLIRKISLAQRNIIISFLFQQKFTNHEVLRYKLRSACVNINTSRFYNPFFVAGHYINDVFNIKDGIWLSYNDAKVDVTSVQEVTSQRDRSGYVFFYMDRLVGYY